MNANKRIGKPLILLLFALLVVLAIGMSLRMNNDAMAESPEDAAVQVLAIPGEQAGCTTYSSVDTPLAVPDGSEAGVVSRLRIPAAGFVSSNITVTVDIDYSDWWDVHLYLCRPVTGCWTPLTEHMDAGNGRYSVSFSDVSQNLTTWWEGPPPDIESPYKPEAPIGMVGSRISGVWRLMVKDPWAGYGTGTLHGWSMTMCASATTPTPTPSPTPTATSTVGPGTPTAIPAGPVPCEAVMTPYIHYQVVEWPADGRFSDVWTGQLPQATPFEASAMVKALARDQYVRFRMSEPYAYVLTDYGGLPQGVQCGGLLSNTGWGYPNGKIVGTDEWSQYNYQEYLVERISSVCYPWTDPYQYTVRQILWGPQPDSIYNPIDFMVMASGSNPPYGIAEAHTLNGTAQDLCNYIASGCNDFQGRRFENTLHAEAQMRITDCEYWPPTPTPGPTNTPYPTPFCTPDKSGAGWWIW